MYSFFIQSFIKHIYDCKLILYVNEYLFMNSYHKTHLLIINLFFKCNNRLLFTQIISLEY